MFHWLLFARVAAVDQLGRCRGDSAEIEICDSGPCESEECIDCSWEEWTDWGPCTCEGIQDRHRVIRNVNTACGKPCEGIKVATRECKPNCQQAPEDCKLADWSVWSECDKTCGLGQKYRQRSVKENLNGGGVPCDGVLKETDSCNVAACNDAGECVMAPWSPWTHCSATCNTGQQERTRSVATASTNGGKPCDDPTSELRGCNTQGCESSVDCRWGDWVEWSACSRTCGGGEKLRSRLIEAAPRKGGKMCEPHTMSEIEPCNAHSCAEVHDCEFTDWSAWSDCSCTCKGTRARTRHVSLYGQNGGKGCNGSLKNVEPCNEDRCGEEIAAVEKKIDCELGPYSEWSQCTVTCATGQQMRSREVVKNSENGGRPCGGDLSLTRGCAEITCPVEVSEKEVKFAPVDCGWDNWGEWEPCSASCNGGFKQRQRTIKQMANCYGRPCDIGDAIEAAPCNTEGCGCQDCVWGPWDEWGSCTCTGLMERHRSIQTQFSTCGKPCTGAKAETKSCNPECGKQRVDCRLADWSEWGECSRSCGGGQEFRTRQVAELSTNGGRPCEGEMKDIRPCGNIHCTASTNCELSPWEEWSSCSSSCGGGQQYRRRSVEHSAHRMGDGCQNDLSEIRGCSEIKCGSAIDCVWDDWTPWSACSASCGNGQKSRDRAIKTAPREGGRLCDAYGKQEVAPCKDRECGMGCVDAQWGPWSDYGLCSASCGKGYQSRNRLVTHGCNHCGKALEGLAQEYKECNSEPCTKFAADCSFGEWSEWGACTCSCNGVHDRSRQVMEYAKNMGKPCDGALKEVGPCNVEICQSLEAPVDCTMAEWSEWGECSAECGGGLTYRWRSISRPSKNGGIPCQGALKEAFPCNYVPCEHAVDCKWSEWAEWDTCSAECGGGQKTRYRHIIQMCAHEGKGCGTQSGVESVGCNVEPCGKLMYCAWGEWTQWGQCSATCGLGQRKRKRNLEEFATKPDEIDILDTGILSQLQDVNFKRFSSDHMLAVFACGVLFTTLSYFVAVRMSRRWHPVETTHSLLASDEFSADEMEIE